MKPQVLQPQEVEVFYILPTIRSRMASALKGQGMKQKDIAGLLCVQESTVSQYLSSKRAAEVKFGSKIDSEIASAVKRIKTREDLIRETQRVLWLAKKARVVCAVHHSVTGVGKNCSICLPFFPFKQEK